MPDAILKRTEAIGLRNKNDAKLHFQNRKNKQFDWDMEDEGDDSLVEDNASDSEMAPFPDIPAKMPGVDLEEQLTSPLPEIEPTEGQNFEARTATAAANANFGPREAGILGQNPEQGEVAEAQQPEEIILNVNVVPAEVEEFGPGDDNASADSYYGPTEETNEQEEYYSEDDKDDEDYAPELLSEYNSSSEEEDYDDEDDEEEVIPTPRSGRAIRPRDRLNLLSVRDEREECAYDLTEESRKPEGSRSAGGKEECSDTEPETDSDSELGDTSKDHSWEDVVLDSIDGEEAIIIEEEEAPVFGAILLQLSLKKGLRQWGNKAEKSATKEMRQLHDMLSFFP